MQSVISVRAVNEIYSVFKFATTLLNVLSSQISPKRKDNKSFGLALVIEKIKSKPKVTYKEFKARSNYLDEVLPLLPGNIYHNTKIQYGVLIFRSTI